MLSEFVSSRVSMLLSLLVGLSLVSVRPLPFRLDAALFSDGVTSLLFFFLFLVVFLNQFHSASRAVAKLGFRVAEHRVCLSALGRLVAPPCPPATVSSASCPALSWLTSWSELLDSSPL
jgi:hypothetical protein